MSESQNWRAETDAGDYFLHQKKQLSVADRRPVIRKGSDLVGPGIGANTVRVTNYNDLLATFNGYYSSAPGALNAPNATDAFVGQVLSDAELGGRQMVTSLSSGTEYRRSFTRSPTDPESIGWGTWTGQRVLPSANGPYVGFPLTEATQTVATLIEPPFIETIGEPGVYERNSGGILLRKQGVYTGHIEVVSELLGTTVTSLHILMPSGDGSRYVADFGAKLGKSYPFTLWVNNSVQGFTVSVHNGNSLRRFGWTFHCTRLGDAV